MEQVIQTTPLSDDQLEVVSKELIPLKPPQFVIGTGQSVGMQRDHNEDSLMVFNNVIGEGVSDLPVGLCIIADGMGGHKNGEIASGVAARVVSKYLINRVFLRFLELHHDPVDESIQETTSKCNYRSTTGGHSIRTGWWNNAYLCINVRRTSNCCPYRRFPRIFYIL